MGTKSTLIALEEDVLRFPRGSLLPEHTLDTFRRTHSAIQDLAESIGLGTFAFEAIPGSRRAQISGLAAEAATKLLSMGTFESYARVVGYIRAMEFAEAEIRSMKADLSLVHRDLSYQARETLDSQLYCMEALQEAMSDVQDIASFRLTRWQTKGGKEVEAVLDEVSLSCLVLSAPTV